MIAGGKSDDSTVSFLGRKLKQPVSRAPQFEGPPSLQTLAFEPDGRAINLTFEERSALDVTAHPFARTDNVFTFDQGRFR